MTIRPPQNVPKIALKVPSAAAALDMSADTFDRRVRPHVKLLLVGNLVLVPVSELHRWAQENASYPLGE